jgi:hypothetical protein
MKYAPIFVSVIFAVGLIRVQLYRPTLGAGEGAPPVAGIDCGIGLSSAAIDDDSGLRQVRAGQ